MGKKQNNEPLALFARKLIFLFITLPIAAIFLYYVLKAFIVAGAYMSALLLGGSVVLVLSFAIWFNWHRKEQRI